MDGEDVLGVVADEVVADSPSRRSRPMSASTPHELQVPADLDRGLTQRGDPGVLVVRRVSRY